MIKKLLKINKLAVVLVSGLVLFTSSAKLVKAALCTQTVSGSALSVSGTACTFYETVDGYDGGQTTLGNGVLDASLMVTNGQTLVFNSALNLSSTASVTLNITQPNPATIKKGYIYVTDADGDGYRDSGTDAVYSTVASGGAPGKVRKYTTVFSMDPISGNLGIDANPLVACPSSATAGVCTTCVNGSKVIAAVNTDPKNECTFSGWNGCSNKCVKTDTVGNNCKGGTAACASGETANVAAGMICSAGSEISGQCSPGYTCTGDARCCYTDVYGEHCTPVPL